MLPWQLAEFKCICVCIYMYIYHIYLFLFWGFYCISCCENAFMVLVHDDNPGSVFIMNCPSWSVVISICDICGQSLWRLTVVVIDVYEFVQEIFDGRHAAKDDGMQRGHPLLLPMTQLKAQIPHALQSLREV